MNTSPLILVAEDSREIRDFLEVDSLGYLSAEGMIDCVRENGETYCTACFTGDYRAPLVDAGAGFEMSSHC